MIPQVNSIRQQTAPLYLCLSDAFRPTGLRRRDFWSLTPEIIKYYVGDGLWKPDFLLFGHSSVKCGKFFIIYRCLLKLINWFYILPLITLSCNLGLAIFQKEPACFHFWVSKWKGRWWKYQREEKHAFWKCKVFWLYFCVIFIWMYTIIIYL